MQELTMGELPLAEVKIITYGIIFLRLDLLF